MRTYHELTDEERAKLQDGCERMATAGMGWIEPETLYESIARGESDAFSSLLPGETSADHAVPNRHERRRIERTLSRDHQPGR